MIALRSIVVIFHGACERRFLYFVCLSPAVGHVTVFEIVSFEIVEFDPVPLSSEDLRDAPCRWYGMESIERNMLARNENIAVPVLVRYAELGKKSIVRRGIVYFQVLIGNGIKLFFLRTPHHRARLARYFKIEQIGFTIANVDLLVEQGFVPFPVAYQISIACHKAPFVVSAFCRSGYACRYGKSPSEPHPSSEILHFDSRSVVIELDGNFHIPCANRIQRNIDICRSGVVAYRDVDAARLLLSVTAQEASRQQNGESEPFRSK